MFNLSRDTQQLYFLPPVLGPNLESPPVEEVLFFVSDEKYTRVQTAQQEALIRKPIKELVAELDPR